MSSDIANSADHQRVIGYDVLLDLARTLGPLRSGNGDPPSALHGETHWKATRTLAGPATVACRPTGTREVTFWSWGAGDEVALSNAHHWLGLEDPLEALDPSHHRVVQQVARQHLGVRMGRFGEVFDRLVPTTLGQLVIAAEAKRSHRRLIARFGEAAPGPLDLRLAPRPDTYVELGSRQFHQVGVERKRAEIIQRVAQRAARLDRLLDITPGDAYDVLLRIRGIGPWTAMSVGRTAFGDPDAVIVGDYNIPHSVAWALEGKRRSNDDEMLELLSPFAGHRGRVLGMLKGDAKPPRNGPKNAFRDIERH